MKTVLSLLMMICGVVLIAWGGFYVLLNVREGVHFSSLVIFASWLTFIVGIGLFAGGVAFSPAVEDVGVPPPLAVWIQWVYLVLAAAFVLYFLAASLNRLPMHPARAALTISFGIIMSSNFVRFARTVISEAGAKSFADSLAFMGFGAGIVAGVVALGS